MAWRKTALCFSSVKIFYGSLVTNGSSEKKTRIVLYIWVFFVLFFLMEILGYIEVDLPFWLKTTHRKVWERFKISLEQFTNIFFGQLWEKMICKMEKIKLKGWLHFEHNVLIEIPKAHSDPSQTSKMEVFAKMVNDTEPLIISEKPPF